MHKKLFSGIKYIIYLIGFIVLFIDWCHVLPKGNQIIAEHIIKQL
mgnify:CR=1 FL=1